ncbi:MAG TPA: DJ-1/PfpI family protein [Solirubrobacterales bacterium]|nr:DJ-1/PfpI family protein [Solirubrobacterales bacterium]
MNKIQVLIYDGFDELDAVAPFEILAAAGCAVELATLDPCDVVRGAHGLVVSPRTTLDPVPDMVVIPGGGWISRAPQGAWAEAQRGALPAALAERHAAGTTMAGVCSGVMLLAASGMLRGRPAVTHRGSIDDLRAAGAEVWPDARVIDDGDVITAGGVTSALDLALHLVERELGPEAAAAEARRIEYEGRGAVFGLAARA